MIFSAVSRFPRPSRDLDRAALFEIGCEELPSGVLPALRQAIESRSRLLRTEYRLGEGSVRVFGTPQRLILLMEDLPDEQEPFRETVIGPPARLAGSLPDAPSPQAQGFAKSQGLEIREIRIVSTPRGDYLAAEKISPVLKTHAVLGELLAKAVDGLPLPKTMRWGVDSGPFLRPVLWVMAFLGDREIDVEWAGLCSRPVTRSPRYAGLVSHPVRGVSHYVGLLEDWGIEPDPEKRGWLIERDLDLALRMEQDVGHIPGGVIRRPDPELTTEVLDLVEGYRVILGSFPDRYLDLPPELIQTVLRVHQRFYVLEDPGKGLSSRFLAISGNPGADTVQVRAGFEKVVRARLEDAQYYLNKDRSRPLASYISDLTGLVFFPGVATIADKIRMARELGGWILDHIPEKDVAATGLSRGELAESIDRLSGLSKADLATGLVREFPELEGVIGAYYWEADHRDSLQAGGSEGRRVRLECDAIREHYRPRHAQDRLPETLPGRVLSLVDKVLHQAVGMSGGFAPSGSLDPYALRRAAHGMLAILRETRWPVNLEALIAKARNLVPGKDPSAELEKFWKERLQAYWEREYPTLLVRSAIVSLAEPVWMAGSRMSFLDTALAREEATSLIALYNRLLNILSTPDLLTAAPPDPSLFRHPSEKELYRLMEEKGLLSEGGWSSKVQEGDWESLWVSASSLVAPVGALFDGVMINDPDPLIRDNRQRLLGILARGISLLGRLDQAPSPVRGG